MSNDRARKVLVIDDEATQRLLVKEYLEEAGYVVRLAEDGKHGLKMAASLVPDVILLDALLPSVDGYRVCSELRRAQKTADIPIILITASKEADAIAKGLAAGATDFITKPVEFQFLADRVEFVLQRADAAKQATVVEPGSELDNRIRTAQEQAWTQAERAMLAERNAEVDRIKADAERKIEEIVQSAEDSIRSNNERAEQRIAELKVKLDLQRDALSFTQRARHETTSGAAGNGGGEAHWRLLGALGAEYLGHFAAIKTHAEALTMPGTRETQSEVASAIIATVNAANRSLNNLKLLASLLSGEGPTEKKPLDLNAVLDLCAASTRSVCESRGIEFEFDVEQNLPLFAGNELHFRYMMLSLLSNALRHSPQGSMIGIAAGYLPDEGIHIVVADQGVGMAAPVLHRVRSALSPANMLPGPDGAVGFGVPIALAIARAYGGRIDFESSVGGGTVATVVLPLAQAHAQAEPSQRGVA